MSSAQQLFDAAGRRRSPATLPEFHAGRAPANKGQRYPADPPPSMRSSRSSATPPDPRRQPPHRTDRRALARRSADQRGTLAHGDRPRPTARIDLDPPRQERSPARGRNGRLGLDRARPLAGSAHHAASRPAVLRDLRTDARARLVGQRHPPRAASHRNCRRRAPARSAPPAPPCPCRRAAARGIALPLIQRQLGHSHLSTTGTYPQGISSEEIISTVHARRAPMMHASAGLDL